MHFVRTENSLRYAQNEVMPAIIMMMDSSRPQLPGSTMSPYPVVV
jgi:hypothetical protein